MFDLFLDGVGEDDFFQVLAFGDEVFHGVLVGDARYVLLDDGARVEVGGHVVRGRADEFDATCVGGVVGFCAHECGQERVVDVDDFVGVRLNHILRNYLHITCKDDEINVVFAQKLHFLSLLFRLVFLVDVEDVVGDAKPLCGGAEVFVVADNQRDVNSPLARNVPRKHIVEAVRHFGDKNRHPRLAVGEVNLELHLMFLRVEGLEVLFDFLGRDEKLVEAPFHPHKEDFLGVIDVLVEIYDVAVVVRDEIGQLGDEPRLVGTR